MGIKLELIRPIKKSEISSNEDVRIEDLPNITSKQYIKGPLPLSWISKSARLNGRVLHVSLALWHIHNLTKSDSIKMQKGIKKIFGISDDVYKRGLEILESAGLILVEKKLGQTPIVTLLLPSE
jgi:hypothetical protein